MPHPFESGAKVLEAEVQEMHAANRFTGISMGVASKMLTLPNPMMARVFPMMETPTYFVLSHLPALTDASAWATFLLRAVMRAMPCSAAAIVFAVGALTTRQPDCTQIGTDSAANQGE